VSEYVDEVVDAPAVSVATTYQERVPVAGVNVHV
jgi:hypothetical protein